MIIRTHKTTDPFARVPKDMLADKRLSWKAKGLLSYLLSKPTDWIVQVQDVINQSTDGRDGVKKAFRELRDAGYAFIANTSQGREWHIADAPRATDGKAVCGPQTEKPPMGFPPLTKNDKTTKKDKTLSEHKVLADSWGAAYKTQFGDDYAFQGGKDGRAIKSLLACSKLGATDLVKIAEAAWKHGGFYCKGATSIAGFYSKFNEIRQELKTKNNGTGTQSNYPRGSRTVGTANERRPNQYEGVGRIGHDPRTRV